MMTAPVKVTVELVDTTSGLEVVSEIAGEYAACCPIFLMMNATVDCCPAMSESLEVITDNDAVVVAELAVYMPML